MRQSGIYQCSCLGTDDLVASKDICLRLAGMEGRKVNELST
jgi:hypothetical protein